MTPDMIHAMVTCTVKCGTPFDKCEHTCEMECHVISGRDCKPCNGNYLVKCEAAHVSFSFSLYWKAANSMM